MITLLLMLLRGPKTLYLISLSLFFHKMGIIIESLLQYFSEDKMILGIASL